MVSAGYLTLRAAGAVQCGGDGGGRGSAGLGNAQGAKGLLGSGDRFGQNQLLRRGLCSCHWKAPVGSCTEGSLRGVCVFCCHRGREVDLAHPWAGLPRCVRVPGLLT